MGEYGRCDFGTPAIRDFKKQHDCNYLCKKLKLTTLSDTNEKTNSLKRKKSVEVEVSEEDQAPHHLKKQCMGMVLLLLFALSDNLIISLAISNILNK